MSYDFTLVTEVLNNRTERQIKDACDGGMIGWFVMGVRHGAYL